MTMTELTLAIVALNVLAFLGFVAGYYWPISFFTSLPR